ncbi:HD-GYP domain-containing protein [Ornithinimicrobium sp. Y1847]|uniref:HD-GYP domain-containing protein n=1 Tax=Ornithinimicrobium sp. Y1847 TaxID=3405419 RepID=UPI003B66D697
MTLSIWVAAVALLAMILGETWRVSSASWRLRDAPLAQAVGIALALSTVWPGPHRLAPSVGPLLADLAGIMGPLLLSACATLVVGLVRSRATLAADLARSLTTVLVAGLLARALAPRGRSLLDRTGDPGEHAAVVAGLLLLVAAVAVAVPILGRALVRARADHLPVWTQLLRHLRRQGVLALATATTAVVIALALRVLGPVSFLVFLLPLVVLLPAVTRQRRILEAQRQTIFALARLTDQAGLTAPGHAARVAQLSVPVARDLGVDDADLEDVEAAALLHDIGQVGLSRPIPRGATSEISARDQRRVAATGAAILARTAELSRLAAVVADVGLPHHRGVVRGDVTAASRVVRVASAYDDLSGGTAHQPGARPAAGALERILRSTPHEYDPAVVEALVRHLERRGAITATEGVTLLGAAAVGP